MSYVLTKAGSFVLRLPNWNPEELTRCTGVLFPREVPAGYSWHGGDWLLVWEDEPAPIPPTLDDLKAAKRASINEIRASLETSGFMYLGKLFDGDQRSADRIQVAAIAAQSALMAGQPFSLDWTTADNSIVTLDAAGVLGMIGAFASRGLELHETAKALKAQADAATTPQELEAIVWP